MLGLNIGNEKAIVEDAKRSLNRASQSIDRIEGYKSEFRNIVSRGISIKNNTSLQTGVTPVNSSMKNSYGSIKSGLDNLIQEIDQKNKK